ncbi:hypothetical protein HPB50_021742 [Hyalomma asiaticum]|uniref:Uncharacterized protein n=1 Tax=Hyalomma asiaticum TaxID=266040 RepID=A0ACB7SYL1_HYAAI|nr:hypothetical protein HPB50_021742 [Hyalomma asiaticum]
MFAQLDNGKLSDVVKMRKSTTSFLKRLEGPTAPLKLGKRRTGQTRNERAKKTACCRKAFEKPSADFSGVCDENEPLLVELPTPYEYFSRYMRKSIYAELADKTNMDSVFNEGRSVQTNEEEIRKLMSLRLLMGVVKYPIYVCTGSRF